MKTEHPIRPLCEALAVSPNSRDLVDLLRRPIDNIDAGRVKKGNVFAFRMPRRYGTVRANVRQSFEFGPIHVHNRSICPNTGARKCAQNG